MGARWVIACTTCAAVVSGAQVLAAGRSPVSYPLPPGQLRASDARLQASTGEAVTFTVTLTRRAVKKGALALTLPRQWTGRSGVSGLRYATVPSKGSASGRGVTVRRRGRVVSFAFTGAGQGAAGRFRVTDRGLPARTYRLHYTWRESGRASVSGDASVVVYTVARPPR